jgi:hypothetical protein
VEVVLQLLELSLLQSAEWILRPLLVQFISKADEPRLVLSYPSCHYCTSQANVVVQKSLVQLRVGLGKSLPLLGDERVSTNDGHRVIYYPSILCAKYI